jgi:hypothetical protein
VKVGHRLAPSQERGRSLVYLNLPVQGIRGSSEKTGQHLAPSPRPERSSCRFFKVLYTWEDIVFLVHETIPNSLVDLIRFVRDRQSPSGSGRSILHIVNLGI